MNEQKREGLPLSALVQMVNNLADIDAQLQYLRDSLTLTYQPVKILSINPIDLAYEQKETQRSIDRLMVKRQAIAEAYKQNRKRAWTPYGTYSHLLCTGVILK